MIDFLIIRSRLTSGMEQGFFFQKKAGMGAFAEVKKDQHDGAVLPVPQEAQLLGFQPVGGGFDDELSQPVRVVDK